MKKERIELNDYFELSGLEFLNDSAETSLSEGTEQLTDSDSIQKFTGIVQEADKKNKNHRIYTKKALKSALDAIQGKIKRNDVFMLVDHPSWMTGGPSLGRVGAVVKDAWMDENKKVWVTGQFIENDAAKEVVSLLKAGVKVGISARGYGSGEYDKKQKALVINEYELEGWDFVLYPAANAKVTKYENADTSTKEAIMRDELMEAKNDIRTEDGLRAAYPELVGGIEQKSTTKVTEMKAQLDASEARIQELTDALATATAAVEAAEAKTVKIQEQADGLSSELSKMKLDAAVVELMKDHKYSKFITIPSNVKTIDEAKTFVEAETAKLDAFAASVAPEHVEGAPTAPAPVADAKPAAPQTDENSINPALLDMWINMAKDQTSPRQ